MKTFRWSVWLGALALMVAAWGGDVDDATKKALDQIKGEWSMVSGSADGEAMPEGMVKAMKRTFNGSELTVTMAGQVFFKAKITIDPTKNPKTIDYEMTEGFTKGKKQVGIYEIEGDTLKSSFASPDGARPADFTSKAGDGRTVTVWKRTKEPAKTATDK